MLLDVFIIYVLVTFSFVLIYLRNWYFSETIDNVLEKIRYPGKNTVRLNSKNYEMTYLLEKQL